jgi:hypothetical protein
LESGDKQRDRAKTQAKLGNEMRGHQGAQPSDSGQFCHRILSDTMISLR